MYIHGQVFVWFKLTCLLRFLLFHISVAYKPHDLLVSCHFSGWDRLVTLVLYI